MENAKVELIDEIGRKLLNASNINYINLSKYENGIYIIKITKQSGKKYYNKVLLNK